MTDDLAIQLEKSDRLSVIAERIGFALWQLQELERISAYYLVLKTKATLGMGAKAGQELIDKAVSRTFGMTLREISGANLFDQKLQVRFSALLSERNWLVHKSRADSRSAIHGDDPAIILIDRVNSIADESLALMHEVMLLAGAFSQEYGVSEELANEQAEATIRGWHDPNAD